MKKMLLVITLLLPLFSYSQFDEENDSIISVIKPDSIFWVDDLQKFAEDSNFIFFVDDDVTHVVTDSINIYLLGSYTRLAIGFVNEVSYIAVKDGNRYRLWSFAPHTIEFTKIKLTGSVKINNQFLISAESYFYTSWSLFNPYAGSFNEEYKTLILFDTTQNSLVFSKTFAHYEERVKDDEKFEKSKTEEGIELDSNDYEYKWYSYLYDVKGSSIKFYPTELYPINNAIEEQNRQAFKANINSKKPAFYYQYEPENKKWVKKIPTH
jgi:hypothetical protein